MKAALYARVSTLDQNPENQLEDLRSYAARRGWEIHPYIDHGVSGTRDTRPALTEMLKAARKRQINIVLVWRLDRLGRSLQHLLLMARSLRLTMRRFTSGFMAAASLCAITPSLALADAVTDWNQNANDAVQATCIAPTLNSLYESRLYAMVHIAIHDALNAIERRSRPYAFRARAISEASPEAAVAAAARDVLVAVLGQLPADCRGTGLEVVETSYAAALAAIPEGAARTFGVGLGQAAAAAILDLRADDGSDTPLVDTAFPQGDDPGEYRFTPGFDFVFAPGWGDVTPFGLQHGSQFRPRPPLDVRGKKYAADFNEVKALGGDEVTGSARTAEQTEIGLFWLESSPQQWNRIARDVSADRGLDLWENARLFALLNVALADGYIGSFETKYHYTFWRPVTAIHLADTDGNPLTEADPLWAPLQLTYPIPDYDSGHAVEGGAAAEVLTRFFGEDVSFSACSFTLPAGQTCADAGAIYRTYTSFRRPRPRTRCRAFTQASISGMRSNRASVTDAASAHMPSVCSFARSDRGAGSAPASYHGAGGGRVRQDSPAEASNEARRA